MRRSIVDAITELRDTVREAFNGESVSMLVEGYNIMRAIDEVEAAILWNGACEVNWILQGETNTQEFWRCECSNCGESFGVEERSSFPFKMTIDKVDIPNFCSYCGAKVTITDE